MELTIELNICLLPDAQLAANLVSASQQYENATPYPCIVTLQDHPTSVTTSPDQRCADGSDHRRRLQLAPHLTLYQLALPVAALAPACAALHTLSSTLPLIEAHATEVAFNAHEGSLEQRYASTDALRAVQSRVIECLNPLRGALLLERDPAGTIPFSILVQHL